MSTQTAALHDKAWLAQASLQEMFEAAGALLHGHFVLRSGLHSRQFFQCALLLQYPAVAEEVCGRLATELRKVTASEAEVVLSPAIGGIVVGQEVARALGVRHIFAEKDDAGGLVLRRGFALKPGERVVVAEDVVTRGGRLLQAIGLAREAGAEVVAAASLVNRSGGTLPDMGCPFVSLLQLHVETFEPNALPPDLAAIPAVRPGSK